MHWTERLTQHIKKTSPSEHDYVQIDTYNELMEIVLEMLKDMDIIDDTILQNKLEQDELFRDRLLEQIVGTILPPSNGDTPTWTSTSCSGVLLRGSEVSTTDLRIY